MKSPNYLIRIPEPCHEDWNSMQPDLNGKFCGACNKVVFDFSNKTDVEIRDILISQRHQNICGHFKRTQIDRPLNVSIQLNQLPRNIGSNCIFAIAVFLAFGTFLFSCTNPHGEKIGKIEVTRPNQKDDTIDGKIALPINLKGDTIVEIVAAVEPETLTGTSVVMPENWNETHVAGGLSFEIEKKIPVYTNTDTANTEFEIPMNQGLTGLMEIEPASTDTTKQDADSITTFKGTNDQPIVRGQLSGFLVYPNPGTGEFMIQYDVLKRSDVFIAVIDMKGARVRTLVDISDQYTGEYHLPVNLSDLPNGVYTINMINEGKRYTEKLIIEK